MWKQLIGISLNICVRSLLYELRVVLFPYCYVRYVTSFLLERTFYVKIETSIITEKNYQ